jgi:hypothetical protein
MFIQNMFLEFTLTFRLVRKLMFLNIVDDLQYMSVIIRFDRETETTLMTQAHFEFICNVFNVRTNLILKERQTTFKQCYYYESSTFNQRIESWWE